MSVKVTGNIFEFLVMQSLKLLVFGERFTRNSTTVVLTFLSKFIIAVVLDIMHILN